MGPAASATSALRQYADASGRASRSELWWCVAALGVAYSVLVVLAVSVAEPFINGTLLLTLAVLVPGTTLGVRRLHDSGRSGWWLLVVLVPFVGLYWLITLYCWSSEPGENQYGPEPGAAG